MEALHPASHLTNPSWISLENQSTRWTKEENKKFESALAIYDEETPERWLKVAALIPGKTVEDVKMQYKALEEDVCEIEAGRVPIPGYDLSSSFSFEFIDDHRNLDVYRRKSSVGRASEQERKKGVPWTEEEHKQFLRGLLKYGKGDWRSISRNFVSSKTPTQVASHAQKYFIRQLSGGKDKRRPSIHDITTVNLAETPPFETEKLALLDPPPPKQLPSLQKSHCYEKLFDWNPSSNGGLVDLEPNYGSHFMGFTSEIAENGIENEQNQFISAYYGALSRPHKSMFQMESSRYQIYG